MRLALSEMLGPRLSLAGAALMGGQQSLGRWADGAYFAADLTRNLAQINYGRRLVPLTGIPGISITRATSAYYTDAQGNLSLFPSGAARIGNRGLLVEGAATNLCLQSQTFGTTWTGTNTLAFGSGSVSDAIAAPDGTTTADKLVEDSSVGAQHRTNQTITVSSGVAHTFSVYAKAAERGGISMRISTATDVCGAHFNLLTGVVSGITGAATITALANGWYRCTVTGTTDSTTATVRVNMKSGPTSVTHETYNGDGSSGLYLWGAQLEATAYATSYIPTTTASATRNADVISVGVTGLTYSAGVTLFAEFERAADTGAAQSLLTCGTVTEGALLYISSGDKGAGYAIRSSVTQYDLQGASNLGVGSINKVAARTASNDGQVCVNGTLTSNDASVTVPNNPTQIQIGVGTHYAHSYLRRLAIFPTAYTDAQLQAITS